MSRSPTGTARAASRKLRLAAVYDHLRGSLWAIPAAFVSGALVLAGVLVRIGEGLPQSAGFDLLVPKSAEGARSALQTVAGSIITGTSIVFSLTIVALQMSAANYSPRVLRTFLRDRGTQIVLGIFLATFVYAFVVLHNVRAASDPSSWRPQVAVALVPLLVLSTVTALVYFIHRLTQAIRVETILREVRDETLETVDTMYGDATDARYVAGRLDAMVPDHAAAVPAARSGFVQAVAAQAIVPVLRRNDLFLVVHASVGDHVLEGAPLAWVWRGDARLGPVGMDEITRDLDDAVNLGNERTMQQDVAFGLRQLVDVAVRALSPGVNDPNTAVTVIGELSVVYRALLRHPLGHREHRDEDGRARLIVAAPAADDYLTIAVQQIALYGRSDVMVLLRLLRMLADLHAVALTEHRPALDRQVDHVLAQGDRGLALAEDRAELRRAAADARAGRWSTGNVARAG